MTCSSSGSLVNWPTCSVLPGCTGVVVNGRDRCLAHLPATERDEVLRGLGPGADIDARGTEFTGELLQDLIESVRNPGTRRIEFGVVSFTCAQFQGTADFDEAVFQGTAVFDHVQAHAATFGKSRFKGDASFVGANFANNANFYGAKFRQKSCFTKAKFDGTAVFDCADFGSVAEFAGAQFAGTATFTTPFPFLHGADFVETCFGADAWFTGVHFHKSTDFREAEFLGAAGFDDTTFNGPATFTKAEFRQNARFAGATFFRTAKFASTKFKETAEFPDAKFETDADFAGAIFSNDARFARTTFDHLATFSEAIIDGPVNFTETRFKGRADFTGATLGKGTRIGQCRADILVLDRAQIGEGVSVRCRVTTLEADDVRCPDGLNLRLDGSVYIDAAKIRSDALTIRYRDRRLELADAVFDAQATIALPPQEASLQEAPPQESPAGDEQPVRLLCLRRVDAKNLTLAGLDLASCRFLECYNRDQLRLDGPPMFAHQPASRWWTHRRVLAEEHVWRARYDRRPAEWFPQECRHPDEPMPEHDREARTGPAARHQASRIQAAYRDLRKGREDAKDEPGAADFYYGEMEMRRLAATKQSAERALLTAYWAISGYGLRATRALAALLVLLIVGTATFATVGFEPATRLEFRPVGEIPIPTSAPARPPSAPAQQPSAPVQQLSAVARPPSAVARPPSAPVRQPPASGPSSSPTSGQAPVYQQVSVPDARPGWAAAVDESIESTTALLHTPQPRRLTAAGRAMEITLRVLGPLLVALAVLAIRGRVKR
jgi:uncharacterized protein YjbI with pentapeptide repeats